MGEVIHGFRNARIKVEMFPDDLAQRVRQINDHFIVGQQQLGIQIVDPVENQEIESDLGYGSFTLAFKCVNNPGSDVVFINERNGELLSHMEGRLRMERTNRSESNFEIGYGDYVGGWSSACSGGQTLVGL